MLGRDDALGICDTVLAHAKGNDAVWVLADPDLLNNHGLARRENARAAMAILQGAHGGEGTIVFDVTLNGLERGRRSWPPLCAGSPRRC